MSSEPEHINLIDRREAVRRVTAILGGIALVGGSGLLTACGDDRPVQEAATDTSAARTNRTKTDFSAEEIAFLDEVADTILPDTKTPGAKAAKVGAFMALMVTDSYDERDQKIFRDGMRKIDEESEKANKVKFMQATPPQRLALLERLDREQKQYTDAREAARNAGASPAAKPSGQRGEGNQGATLPGQTQPAPGSQPPSKQPDDKTGDAYLSDQRQENAVNAEVGSAAALTDGAPAHYFRMIKELTLLGYFTSEIGCTKAQRYAETPGRYDPCVPYKKGEPAWAPHA